MNDNNSEKEKPEAEAATEEKIERTELIPEWEQELETYPLREKADDPRWAVRIVWIWTGFALSSIIFIVIMLILGVFYD